MGKRRANNSQFVYYGVFLHDEALEEGGKEPSSNTEAKTSLEVNGRKMEDILVEYTHQCLTALGIHNGPSHAEVMWLEDENCPCLVEVGARAHGGDATFMVPTQAAIGYNQISLMVDSCLYSDENNILSLPKRPLPLKSYAVDLTLVSYVDGICTGFNEEALQTIHSLKSFKSIEFVLPVGGALCKTVDLMTSPGAIQLSHENAKTVIEDYNCIHDT